MKFNFKYKQAHLLRHCQWLEKDQPLVLRWAAHLVDQVLMKDDDIDEDSNTIEDDDEYKVEAVESMPERIPKIKVRTYYCYVIIDHLFSVGIFIDINHVIFLLTYVRHLCKQLFQVRMYVCALNLWSVL